MIQPRFLSKPGFKAALCTLVLFAAVAVNCAKAPDKKLASAREAIVAAKTAESDIYAEKDFSYAQELFSEACNEIEILKEKRFSLFFRKYADVNRKLDSVIIIAREAAELAKTAKNWLKQQEIDTTQ